jgi:hypothetical protein
MTEDADYEFGVPIFKKVMKELDEQGITCLEDKD